ncbi:MAG: O-methyltransferase [Eubacterium sp.]|jgi:Predicted O-methyltransferase|nr:O-methyltransferase [Eubacterium sp.]
MITEERITEYIHSLDNGNPPFLEELEKQAKLDDVPVIRKETQALIRLLISIKKPGSILEVGTAVGFSALFMAQYSPVETQITTIENYPPRIREAKENIERAGKEEQIRLLEGDAMEILPALQECYDFIFMDAAKAQYICFLPELLQHLNPGGILVSDNVLQEGDIIQSHFAVIRRNRTIYKRMREYLYELTHHERLVTAVLPVGDGVAVSCMAEREAD